jgi:hypothetical protein
MRLKLCKSKSNTGRSARYKIDCAAQGPGTDLQQGGRDLLVRHGAQQRPVGNTARMAETQSQVAK